MRDSRSRSEGPRRRRGVARASEARGADARAADAPRPGATAPMMADDRAVPTPVATAADAAPAAPSAELIRMRAYELYLARGGSPGYDLEDWLAAERSLLGTEGRSVTQAPPPDAASDAAEAQQRP